MQRVYDWHSSIVKEACLVVKAFFTENKENYPTNGARAAYVGQQLGPGLPFRYARVEVGDYGKPVSPHLLIVFTPPHNWALFMLFLCRSSSAHINRPSSSKRLHTTLPPPVTLLTTTATHSELLHYQSQRYMSTGIQYLSLTDYHCCRLSAP